METKSLKTIFEENGIFITDAKAYFNATSSFDIQDLYDFANRINTLKQNSETDDNVSNFVNNTLDYLNNLKNIIKDKDLGSVYANKINLIISGLNYFTTKMELQNLEQGVSLTTEEKTAKTFELIQKGNELEKNIPGTKTLINVSLTNFDPNNLREKITELFNDLKNSIPSLSMSDEEKINLKNSLDNKLKTIENYGQLKEASNLELEALTRKFGITLNSTKKQAKTENVFINKDDAEKATEKTLDETVNSPEEPKKSEKSLIEAPNKELIVSPDQAIETTAEEVNNEANQKSPDLGKDNHEVINVEEEPKVIEEIKKSKRHFIPKMIAIMGLIPKVTKKLGESIVNLVKNMATKKVVKTSKHCDNLFTKFANLCKRSNYYFLKHPFDDEGNDFDKTTKYSEFVTDLLATDDSELDYIHKDLKKRIQNKTVEARGMGENELLAKSIEQLVNIGYKYTPPKGGYSYKFIKEMLDKGKFDPNGKNQDQIEEDFKFLLFQMEERKPEDTKLDEIHTQLQSFIKQGKIKEESKSENETLAETICLLEKYKILDDKSKDMGYNFILNLLNSGKLVVKDRSIKDILINLNNLAETLGPKYKSDSKSEFDIQPLLNTKDEELDDVHLALKYAINAGLIKPENKSENELLAETIFLTDNTVIIEKNKDDKTFPIKFIQKQLDNKTLTLEGKNLDKILAEVKNLAKGQNIIDKTSTTPDFGNKDLGR
jgi:hypothetical protein